jgi:hypothetical protein
VADVDPNDTPAFFEPVLDLLRGDDPDSVARRAAISVEELFERRDAFLHSQARKAEEEDLVLQKVGRNDPCPCGSGKKYKKCCMRKHQEVRARMDPEEVRRRTQRERDKEQRNIRAREGYTLLGLRSYQKARALAQRWLEVYPEDDHFYDVIATSALYLGDLDEAIGVSESRWKASIKEKEFFLMHGRHSYDELTAPIGHAYAPQAWLEKYWAALKAKEYSAALPADRNPQVAHWLRELQKADDLHRFPQQREEGLKRRKDALAVTISEIKDAGPKSLPYLIPLCTRYSWTALLIPEILLHFADDASIRCLVEISMFHYPFLSEECLSALEQLGERSLPHLVKAFHQDREFDPIKLPLISVAGHIGTPEALEWITSLLDHSEPTVVNWSARALVKCAYAPALERMRAASLRAAKDINLDWAIEEMSKIAMEIESR